MESKQNLQQVSILVSPSEKQQLQKLAEERGLSVSQMGRRAIQAFLYAIKHKDKKKRRLNKNSQK